MIRIDVHPTGENLTIQHACTHRQVMYDNLSQSSYEAKIAPLHPG
jgi:hypothetical protein